MLITQSSRKGKKQQSCNITIHVYGIPKSLMLYMDWSQQLKKGCCSTGNASEMLKRTISDIEHFLHS